MADEYKKDDDKDAAKADAAKRAVKFKEDSPSKKPEGLKSETKKGGTESDEAPEGFADASEAKKQAYATDKMDPTSDKKSWSVKEEADGQFGVYDDADDTLTGKWPTRESAEGHVRKLEDEDQEGRSTT